MAADYNAMVAETNTEIEDANHVIRQKVSQGALEAEVGAAMLRKHLLAAAPPESFTLSWAFKFRKSQGWSSEAANTSGVYLEYDHPRMQACRDEIKTMLASGCDVRVRYVHVVFMKSDTM
jgi:hypothetical protein